MADDKGVLVREFNTPVFHQFHHQREAEAILAAEEVIRQQASRPNRRLLAEPIPMIPVWLSAVSLASADPQFIYLYWLIASLMGTAATMFPSI